MELGAGERIRRGGRSGSKHDPSISLMIQNPDGRALQVCFGGSVSDLLRRPRHRNEMEDNERVSS